MEKCSVIQYGKSINADALTNDEMRVYCVYQYYAATTHSIVVASSVPQRVAVNTNGVVRYVDLSANVDTTISFDGETHITFSDKYHVTKIDGYCYFNLDDLKYNEDIVWIQSYQPQMFGDISSLSGKKALTRIGLAGVSEITGDITVLNTLPAIKNISLGGTGIHGNLTDLAQNTEVVQFRIYSTAVKGNIGLIYTKYPNLRELVLKNNKKINGAIDQISVSKLPSLTGAIDVSLNNLSGSINTLILNTTVTNINAANNPSVEGSKATFKSANGSNTYIQANKFNFNGTQVTD